VWRTHSGANSVNDSHGQNRLAATRGREHEGCFVCDPANPRGFGLGFQVCVDGSVIAGFACEKVFQGYMHCMHGGVICSLLDGAMTNCLFARGIVAVTAELSVRFLSPVAIDRQACVKAWLDKSYPPLYILKAELLQGGTALATASGKFMYRSTDGEVGEDE
jgi:acyl-coenzyme A thioesterase PaaI-like protein